MDPWGPGGLGVFDPGINALSLLTEESAMKKWQMHEAVLEFHGEPSEAPIAARLALRTEAGVAVRRGIRFPARRGEAD